MDDDIERQSTLGRAGGSQDWELIAVYALAAVGLGGVVYFLYRMFQML